MVEPSIERVPARLTGLFQSDDTYTAWFGLENGGSTNVTFKASTAGELVGVLVTLRYALGWDIR